MLQTAYHKVGCVANRVCGWMTSGREKPALLEGKDGEVEHPSHSPQACGVNINKNQGRNLKSVPQNSQGAPALNSPTLEPVSRIYTVIAQWCKVTVMCAATSNPAESRHSWHAENPDKTGSWLQKDTPEESVISQPKQNHNDINEFLAYQVMLPTNSNFEDREKGLGKMNSPRTRWKQENASRQLDEYFYNLVLQLVDEGENVNYSDFAGYTPLMLACANRNHKAIQLLIKLGNDVNACNQEGATALMLSAACDDVQSVKTLVNAGSDLDIMDCHQQTALMECSVRGSPSMVRALVESGASTNLRDSRGRTALHLAILHGHYSVAHCLVSYGMCEINAKDEDGYSPLYLAAWDPGHPDHEDPSRLSQSVILIHRLVEKGADVDCCDSRQVACLVRTWNRKPVVKALIQNGAYVNRTLKVGKIEYPLPIVAALEGDFEMVNLLWKAGYDSASLFSRVLLLDDKHSTIISELSRTFARPLSLKDICRLVIRRSCGRFKLKCKLAFLPLPTQLITFLCFEQ